MDPIKVGKFIALNRKKLKMTQADLGNNIGVSPKTISRWETGKYMPDIALLLPLSEILEVSVHEILLGEYIEDKDMKEKTKETTETIMHIAKKKRKRIESFYIIIILLLLLCGVFTYYNEGFSLYGNVNHVNKVIGSSLVYSEEEINDAMDVVIDKFKRTFHGCTLTEVRYSDEDYLDESSAWADTYNVEKAIVIYCEFDVSPKGASSVFNPGSTYTQYKWILVSEKDTWIIRNQGMG